MANKPKRINRPWLPERKPFERQRHASDFDYNGRKWRNVRRSKLDKDPLCEYCAKVDKVTQATVVDHEPRAKVLIARGDDPYDEKYLFSSCKTCHNSKSGRERHL
ncbi:MAG: hypothetical protein BM557_09605 [Flavobacterium sp. MedPE-SWcel]|uniref:HNH endonuclease n=1 Tax=uncultured Flavobacterium sp. TaxID=165435 RepID=UPI000919A68A|nr:HNH endonuclease [uncultured Flavobacterium sp.]OIQ16559.1 MAG: hypothetical protein BM557_09605 [Flavobacterium sp. MedPE-SWcel]